MGCSNAKAASDGAGRWKAKMRGEGLDETTPRVALLSSSLPHHVTGARGSPELKGRPVRGMK